MKNAFYFILKALFIVKIFLWSSRNNIFPRKLRLISNSWRHNLVNKLLQYAWWPISYEVKKIRQWNFVSLWIEHNKRNNFLWKSWRKRGIETTILDKIFGTKWSNPVELDRKKKFGLCLCVFFNCYFQSLSSWRGTKH